MEATYGKKEKLKSKQEIEAIFAEGNVMSQYPIRMVYKKMVFQDGAQIKVGVSVGKRNFKKAVDRNRIKRLLREVYRSQKYTLLNAVSSPYAIMFIYTGKEVPDAKILRVKMQKVILKFIATDLKTI